MEYKVIHSANLQEDISAAAAEGWELFDTPQPWRQPQSPNLWLLIMERDVTTGMDYADGVTLATIKSWADSHETAVHPDSMSEHARGYSRAVRDVNAILAVHGQPPNVAVHYGQ